MELRKSGFTIAEFVISITIMFVVMGAVVSVPFKKAKQTENIQLNAADRVCDCNRVDNGFCEFTIENSTGRNEFFEVTLVGGGAAAGSHKGGGAGEVKKLVYPALHGVYRVQLGRGGTGTGANRNGGTTAIYAKIDDHFELLDFALGGTSSDETIIEEDMPADITNFADYTALMEHGEEPSVTIGDGQQICGTGGTVNSAQTQGIMGGATITW